MYIPIIITTYERPEYFNNTLISLMNSNADLSYLYIFDDCSQDKEKINLLKDCMGVFNVVTGIENRGTVLNTIPAIDYAYEHSKSPYIALVQDDVVFSKSWLEVGIKKLDYLNTKHFKIAYISLYNRGEEKKTHIMKNGHPGGVCWIINRKFWTWYRKTFDNRDTDYLIRGCDANSTRDIVDYKLTLRLRKHGWTVGCVGNSLVQHVGDKSTLHKKNMAYCRVKNFVGENV